MTCFSTNKTVKLSNKYFRQNIASPKIIVKVKTELIIASLSNSCVFYFSMNVVFESFESVIK